MNRVISGIFKKLIVLLAITSMLSLSVKDRSASASVYTIKNENKAGVQLYHWKRVGMNYFEDYESGFYPVMIAYPSKYGYFITAGLNRAKLSGDAKGGYYFTSTNIDCFYLAKHVTSAGKASDLDLVKNNPAYVALDEVRVGAEEFYTTQITNPWCIGIKADGSGNDPDVFNLYFSMSVKDKMDYSLKIVDGFRVGYGNYYSGKAHWTVNAYGTGQIKIRHVCGTNKYDYIRTYDGQMRSCYKGSDGWDVGTYMYMYIGKEYAHTVLDDRYTVESGSVLNINDKDEKGRKSICILPEGSTMIIAPGAVVIVKGIFICNGSIENFGTLLLCDGAYVAAAQTEHVGACTIHNYGAQASVNLPQDAALNYLKDSWQKVHDKAIDGSTLKKVTDYFAKGNAEGNMIIRKGASLLQNSNSYDLTLLGGAELVNQGQLAIYRDLVIKDSTVVNSGALSLGFGWPVDRDMQRAMVVIGNTGYILNDTINVTSDTAKRIGIRFSEAYYIGDKKMCRIDDTTSTFDLKPFKRYSSDTIKFK